MLDPQQILKFSYCADSIGTNVIFQTQHSQGPKKGWARRFDPEEGLYMSLLRLTKKKVFERKPAGPADPIMKTSECKPQWSAWTWASKENPKEETWTCARRAWTCAHRADPTGMSLKKSQQGWFQDRSEQQPVGLIPRKLFEQSQQGWFQWGVWPYGKCLNMC